MSVNSAQFQRGVGIFNNGLTCNMSQKNFSDITMRQCHITTFCIFSPLVLLHQVLFLRIISPPRQFRIKILKVAFTIQFLFMCIFNVSIHIWSYTRTVDRSGYIEKNPGPRLSSSLNFLIRHSILNNITAHSYGKFSPLKSFNSKIRYNMIVRNIPGPQCSFTRFQFGNTKS